jgi:beta-glucosidase
MSRGVRAPLLPTMNKAVSAGLASSVFVVLALLAGCQPSGGGNPPAGTGGSVGGGGRSNTDAGVGSGGSAGGGGGGPGSGGAVGPGSGGAVGPGSGGSVGPGSGGAVGPGSGGAVGPGSGGAMGMGTGGAAPCVPLSTQYPFQDPCRPIEERVTNLLSLLTNDEKIDLLHENQFPISRLGIPFFTAFTEGTHGLGWSNATIPTKGGATPPVMHWPSTQFPQTFGLSHSWDPEVMRIVGETTGREARVYNAMGTGVGISVRAPVIDLLRDPRWGRNEEGFGEDPYLSSELGKAFVAGLQGNDPRYLLAASTLKHFIAYNNETDRNSSNSVLDDRNLREYYGVPFFELLRNARAQGVMSAYNKINGVPGAVTPLMKSLLVGEWGFDGMICIDAWAAPGLIGAPPGGHMYMNWTIEQAVSSIIKSGQILTGPETDRDALRRALSMGMVTAADLDGALRGNLRMRFRLGDLDPAARVPWKQMFTASNRLWEGAEHRARALDVARRSVVLLKNASNTLPLSRTGLTSIAVIGPRADSIVRDWYGGTLPYKVTPRQGIATKLGTGVTVRTAALTTTTVSGNTTNVLSTDAINAAVTAAQMSTVAVVFVGNHPVCGPGEDVWDVCTSPYEGRERYDRRNIGLEPSHQMLVQSVLAANPRTIVFVVSGTPHGLSWAQQNVPAVLHIANSGQEIGTAIADVLFGDYNPGGKTSMTWYASETDIPTSVLDYDIRKGTTYLYFAGTPVYPFGHGLSYTTFAYSGLTLSAASVGMSGSVNVSVNVMNMGTRAGDEVVQMYVAYPASTTTPRPRNQLRGFRRITLQPGAMQQVTFTLRGDQLTYWNTSTRAFAVQPGMVEVQIGSSSRDIRQRMMLNVTQ